jgi:hypothetical protein
MALKEITNRIANHRIFSKLAVRASKKPDVKINFDAATRSVVDEIGVNGDLKYVTGLINLQTGQMHLKDSVAHDILAAKKGLLKDINTLIEGWHGFRIYCTYVQPDNTSMLLEITPKSGKFGGVPIKDSSVFEGHMKGLFGSKADSILFSQMEYERNFTEQDRGFWVTVLNSQNMLYVPKSLSNKELTKWLSKSRLI